MADPAGPHMFEKGGQGVADGNGNVAGTGNLDGGGFVNGNGAVTGNGLSNGNGIAEKSGGLNGDSKIAKDSAMRDVPLENGAFGKGGVLAHNEIDLNNNVCDNNTLSRFQGTPKS